MRPNRSGNVLYFRFKMGEMHVRSLLERHDAATVESKQSLRSREQNSEGSKQKHKNLCHR